MPASTDSNSAPHRPSAGLVRQDAAAGLSIAGLLLPEAVAYSGIANLPPQAGIIALFAGLACYAMLGTSRFAIVSATSSSAAVLGAATASLAGGDVVLRLGLAAGLVLLTGGYFVLAGIARLGSVTDFISKPVLRGFAFGLALVIVIRQCAAIVGVHPADGDLLRFAVGLLQQFAEWNVASIAVGGVALGLLLLMGRVHRLPAGLIVITLGIAATYWLDLPHYGVSVVGPIQLQLHAPALPGLSRAEWLRLGEVGFALAMVLYSESYTSIRSFAIKHGDPVAPDRDLLALGASNLASGLFLGMPVGAGYSATSANEAAGAGSRLAGGIAAVTLLAVVLMALPSIALTPQPVLAAIVINAVRHALNPSVLRPYFVWHRDRLVAIASVIAVLWLGVLDGLLAAIAISLMMLLRRFSVSTVGTLGRLGSGHDFVSIADHPDAQPVDGLLILRPDEPVFFANAERILAQARRRISTAGPSVHGVVISLEETFDLDSSSLEALLDFFDWAAAEHKRLVLARLKHPVHQLLKRATASRPSAPILIGLSVDDAVRIVQERAPSAP
ncbi:MAG TPA: SulP family inorganic anion transporter [Steroidobacteraceae bacterium]|nr:SulP family inorganic anion transporter [Steroidobacteraceae bacterium]